MAIHIKYIRPVNLLLHSPLYSFSLAASLDLSPDFSVFGQHLHSPILCYRLKYNESPKKTGKTKNKGKRKRRKGIKLMGVSYNYKIFSEYQSKYSQRNYTEYRDHDEKRFYSFCFSYIRSRMRIMRIEKQI